MENVLIIGSGPAALTAALYCARANLSPLVIEGLETGGQLMTTTEVENYPGFPEGVLGPDLIENMRKQAEKFGARFVQGNATKVQFQSLPLTVQTDDNSYEAKTVIISTGARPKKLNIESEKRLWGYGISSCATCDGAFFRNKEVCVIGGGDSALEEALFLTRFASKVTLIHRRDELRASKIMQDRATSNKKIFFLWDSVVDEYLASEINLVRGVNVRNVKTNVITEYLCDGVFLGIGHIPNTDLFKGQLELDENGYIVTQPPRTFTNIKGVFAAGDVVDHIYRQAITAAAMGCKAAIDAERYLGEMNL